MTDMMIPPHSSSHSVLAPHHSGQSTTERLASMEEKLDSILAALPLITASVDRLTDIVLATTRNVDALVNEVQPTMQEVLPSLINAVETAQRHPMFRALFNGKRGPRDNV